MTRVSAALLALLAAPLFAETPSADLMQAVTRARYAVRLENGTPVVSNYAQDLRARFGNAGIEVETRRGEPDPSGRLNIRLSRWGRDGSLDSPGLCERAAADDRVEYRCAGITEWWLNSPRGLEQGFSIPERRAGAGPLVIDLEVSGGWRAESRGEAIRLAGPRGEQLQYAELVVNDADGARVDANLSEADGKIRISIHDGSASYPLTVDPILTNQEAKLFPDGTLSAFDADFGRSVSIDGDTAVVGAPLDDTDQDFSGIVYVMTRTAGVWTQQAQLFPADRAVNDRFGNAVSISGNTIIAGASMDDTIRGTNGGSAYVFVRSGADWSQQAHLVSPDGGPSDAFGHSVGVSVNYAIVGAPSHDDAESGVDSGGAYVFERSGSTWNLRDELWSRAIEAGDAFGRAVAISGTFAIVGSELDDTLTQANVGSARVFIRGSFGWTQDDVITASDGIAEDRFGSSVAINGTTAVVGSIFQDTRGANAGAAYVFVGSGGSWTEQAKLLASDGAAGDNFGQSVAVNGNTAVIGAPGDDTAAGTNAGSAYVFVRSGSTWSQQSRLLASGGGASDSFGLAVAISGETAIGGSTGNGAWVFVRSGTTWSEQARLLPADAWNDFFGYSVAIDGDTALIGVPYDDTATVAPNNEGGSVYVLVRSGTAWTRQAQIAPSTLNPNDFFGTSVALSGDTAVIGAPGQFAGAAYVYVRSGSVWTQQDVIQTSAVVGEAHFGRAVAISANTALVGAPNDDTAAGADAGSAFVFIRSGSNWSQQAELVPVSGQAGANFGSAVAISGDTAVIGEPFADGTATDSGFAYAFVRTGAAWSQQRRFSGNGGVVDWFGRSVAISGNTTVIGAPGEDVGPNEPDWDFGRVYVFVRNGTNWTQQAQLRGAAVTTKDQFGTAVALVGDTAVIGSVTEWAFVRPGSAYVFVRAGTNWGEQARLTAGDENLVANFGRSVALSGNTVLVGATGDSNEYGWGAGAAYVFRLVNDAPAITAAPIDRTRGTAGSAINIAAVSDTEDAAATLVVTAISIPAGITISGITNTNGTISATVGASCTAALGENQVTLRVQDGGNATATANLTVTVLANPAPVVGDYANTSARTGVTKLVIPSAAPSDNGTITSLQAAAITTGFTGTIAARTSTGELTISNPNAGAHAITVTATDNCGTQSEKTFILTVENPAPNAEDDSYRARENDTLSVAAPGVLANDNDSQSLPLTAEQVSGPAHGSLTINPDGSFEYTPTANYSGPDSFAYRASNGEDDSEIATVWLNVSPLGTSTKLLTYTRFEQPCRVIDTRNGGGPLVHGAAQGFLVSGDRGFAAQGGNASGCGVPLGEATAVVINFVAVAPSAAGNLRASAYPNPIPAAGSIINYQALTPALNVANGIAFPICDAAKNDCAAADITIQANGGSTQLVADVLGYFSRFAEEETRAIPGAHRVQGGPVPSMTCTSLTSITVDAPVAGTVTVNASLLLKVTHAAGTSDSFVASVNDEDDECQTVSDAGEAAPSVIDATLPSGTYYRGLRIRRSFEVPAGAHTFYINGLITGGTSAQSIENIGVDAVFYPE